MREQLIRFVKNLFSGNKCDCGGWIKYAGDDWTGNIWLSVYECKECKKEYV